MSYDRLIIALVFFFPLGLMALALWRSATSRTSFATKGSSFATRNKCIVEQRYVPVLDQRFREQEQAAALGVGVGAILYLPLALVDDGRSLLVSFPLIMATTSLVRSLHICWQSTRSAVAQIELSRVARLRSVGAEDLVSPWLRVAAWLTVLSAVGAVAVAASIGAPQRWVWGLSIAGVLLVTCQLIVDGTARWVAAQPERAEDSAHLYWQDAFRAEALSEAYVASAMASGLVMVVLWPLTFDWPPWVGFPLLGMALALVLPASRNGRLRFRRRLWGWLGPGEVIPPGSSLVSR